MPIFISYARKDRGAIAALHNDLQHAHYRVWMDNELTGGQAWWDAILEQIRACDLFIFALSPDSLKSRACSAELAYALALNRPLLPVLVHEVALQLVHPVVARTQIVDYRKRSVDSALALMAAVANRPPAPSLPNPLPEAPAAPMSYMNEFRELVEAPALSYQQQKHLLGDLEEYLGREEERSIALQLVQGLRERPDIAVAIARDIDKLLGSVPTDDLSGSRPHDEPAEPRYTSKDLEELQRFLYGDQRPETIHQAPRPSTPVPNPTVPRQSPQPGRGTGSTARRPATEALPTRPAVRRRERPASRWRVPIVIGLAIAALLIGVALATHNRADGRPSTSTSAAPADFTEQGDIEVWHDKDVSGNFQKLIDEFNAQHPNGKVTLHELPGGIGGADQQRQQLIHNTQIKNPKMAVMSVDVVWTAEFAAKGYIEALPADMLPTIDFLPASVDSATYSWKLYAYPSTTDGGLLYYRKDLLDKYGLKPPTTFDEMKAACHRIQAGENDPKLGCFAGQYNQHEGMTVNIDEAIRGAGGVIVGDDGKPNVATPEAVKGLQTLVDWFRDGDIPEAALTWRPAQGRKAFQNGELIFHRNWGGAVYDVLSKTDGSSKVAGKFDVAALPGITGPGVSSLGGQNYVIAKYAENKGTAVDFLKFMASPEAQKSYTMATSNAPVLASLYTDPDIIKKYPYMPTLLRSTQTAKPRPKAVDYVDVTSAIQDAAFSALQGRIQPDMALQALQAKLETLIK
jgi:multiple sugar transport system substrate-binding protein